ncbi:glycosyltransferase family 9 protein [Streptomyces bohaiensis]|uniref:Glycosyltransferase family 9 protein n=1 Tax=Streptomyces bohaiensis TaxID=1431344 RepID=A0ABX1C6B4_9ACTN|nr:glycosyltransferase family 9 protein [Streptomyces bohaiensis]NJQ13593.1 glycosyltransferase family 9 protein [Streptomyces bohaiensis]
MTRRPQKSAPERPARFAAPDLAVRDCVELAVGLASYARRHGLARVEVSGPPVLGELIEEFGLDQVHFVDTHQQPAVDIEATPRTWRCGQRGLRCFSDQLADTAHAPRGAATSASTLAEGTVLRFARHNRLGDALSIVTGLEHYCCDNAVKSVAVTGSPILSQVVELFACERVRSAPASTGAVSGDAIFARASWSLPWLDRFHHSVHETYGGRVRYGLAPLPLRERPARREREDVVYCQFDARSGTPLPRPSARRLVSQAALHGDVRILGGPDTSDYLGSGVTYVRAELSEIVARLLSCRFFVGCDSGLGHLAGCLDVPGVIVSTDDFETTWSFFRNYSSLNVIPSAAADLLLP